MNPILVASSLEGASQAHWTVRATVLWSHRRIIVRLTAISLLLSLGIAFLIPKRYTASASIMPPDQQNSGAMVLAALASRSGGLGTLGGLAGGLLGGHTNTALFVDLLHSGTVTGHLIDRFDLRHVYHVRYSVDAAKRLARCSTITDDKKSGVITIKVEDTSPERARDLAQAYLDELNKLVTQTSTSTARKERVFIEHRLATVKSDLEIAQLQLSEFSSKNSAVDLKEQTRAMVDAGAKVQGTLLVEQSELQSLRQIYGDGNVRVRGTEARIAVLRRELDKLTGSSAPLKAGEDASDSDGQLYPSLRQLPRLAVPYADLYRSVRVQETVFELLTQQYEMARIEEAKDIPVVSIIDPPGIPEKKSFPPRLLLALVLACLSSASIMAALLIRNSWSEMHPDDPRKVFAAIVLPVVANRISSMRARLRGLA